jgi:hypothetical protein
MLTKTRDPKLAWSSVKHETKKYWYLDVLSSNIIPNEMKNKKFANIFVSMNIRAIRLFFNTLE